MKDIFKRQAKIGDTILIIPNKDKYFNIGVISGFTEVFGKPSLKLEGGKKYMSEFLILKRKDGTKYFDNNNLPMNSIGTFGRDKKVL